MTSLALKMTTVACAAALGCFGPRAVWAQAEPGKGEHGMHGEHGKHGEEPGTKAETTAKAHMSAKLDAVLVEAEKKAQDKAATVKVTASGIKIIDPATVGEKAAPGQGHLHYTVDDGPTIATTATKLSFHGLTSGKHTIKVVLAGNDHSPLGPEETLEVSVP